MRAEFWNIGGDEFAQEECLIVLSDDDDVPSWDSFTITPTLDADGVEVVDGCPTYATKEGKVGYTEEIDTYVYLEFTETGEKWRLATF